MWRRLAHSDFDANQIAQWPVNQCRYEPSIEDAPVCRDVDIPEEVEETFEVKCPDGCTVNASASAYESYEEAFDVYRS